MDTLLDRFCRYAKVETTAVEDTDQYPSSPKMLELGEFSEASRWSKMTTFAFDCWEMGVAEDDAVGRYKEQAREFVDRVLCSACWHA